MQQLLKQACKSNYENDAIILSKAATMVHEDIFNYTGFQFSKNLNHHYLCISGYQLGLSVSYDRILKFRIRYLLLFVNMPMKLVYFVPVSCDIVYLLLVL